MQSIRVFDFTDSLQSLMTTPSGAIRFSPSTSLQDFMDLDDGPPAFDSSVLYDGVQTSRKASGSSSFGDLHFGTQPGVQSISAQPLFGTTSHEELRWSYYQSNYQGVQSISVFGTASHEELRWSYYQSTYQGVQTSRKTSGSSSFGDLYFGIQPGVQSFSVFGTASHEELRWSYYQSTYQGVQTSRKTSGSSSFGDLHFGIQPGVQSISVFGTASHEELRWSYYQSTYQARPNPPGQQFVSFSRQSNKPQEEASHAAVFACVVNQYVLFYYFSARPNPPGQQFVSFWRQSNKPQEEASPTFSCPICMEKMDEIYSTICGHVFCQPCINAAIRAQKKCPTCRKRLRGGNFLRIFLP